MSVVGVLKGASLAFLAYTVPLVVLKRKFSLEVLRSASAFATFVASYRALRATTDADRPVAAGVAALAGCVVDPSFASPLFTFWLFTKGVRVFLPSVTTSVVPVGTLMLAGAYAIPTGYKHPNEVHPTYRKFLESWVTFVGVKLKHWRFPPAGSGKILSDGIHPNSSMSWFMLARAIPGCFYLAAKFNLPLYAAGALAGWNKLDVVRHLTNFLRSVTFLGGYVSSCWLGVLLFSKYVSHGEITRTQCMSFAWIFGLFGLVERHSRQVELAAYILAHTLFAIYTRMRNAGVLGSGEHRLFFALLLSIAGVAPLFNQNKDDKPASVLWSHLFEK